MQDREFVSNTAMAGLAEVAFGEMAARKAVGTSIRDFAERMAQEHRRVNAQLKNIADRHGIIVPGTLDDFHAQREQELDALAGDTFDREYIRGQVEAHEKAVNLFKSYLEIGANNDLREFARTMLPALIEHLDLARELDNAETRAGS